jgi:hypothetical protein
MYREKEMRHAQQRQRQHASKEQGKNDTKNAQHVGKLFNVPGGHPPRRPSGSTKWGYPTVAGKLEDIGRNPRNGLRVRDDSSADGTPEGSVCDFFGNRDGKTAAGPATRRD